MRIITDGYIDYIYRERDVDMADFDNIKSNLRKLGVTKTEVTVLAGKKIFAQYENMLLEYIRAFSGSMVNIVGENKYTHRFTKNGVTFNLFGIYGLPDWVIIVLPGLHNFNRPQCLSDSEDIYNKVIYNTPECLKSGSGTPLVDKESKT